MRQWGAGGGGLVAADDDVSLKRVDGKHRLRHHQARDSGNVWADENLMDLLRADALFGRNYITSSLLKRSIQRVGE